MGYSNSLKKGFRVTKSGLVLTRIGGGLTGVPSFRPTSLESTYNHLKNYGLISPGVAQRIWEEVDVKNEPPSKN